jgi:ABC-2 type transport system permease protein
MKPIAGSLPWLVGHDLTVNWRRFSGMFGALSPVAVWAICGAGILMLHLLAWPVVLWLVRLKLDKGGAGPVVGAVPVFGVLAWMSAQSLLGTARTLQERGSMDLLLSSPLPPRLVVASRLVSLAASSLGSVAVLLLPLANMGWLLDGPIWLAMYPTLAALALIGTALGMAIGIGLFLWCSPRRARLIAHLSAAFIGGAFMLAMQIAAMLSGPTREAIAGYVSRSGVAHVLDPAVWAAQGDLLSVLGFTAFALAVFLAATVLLQEGFVKANLRAAGASSGLEGSRSGGPRTTRFGSGVAETLRRKEWRLLCRDHGVFAQLTLQIIYTVPLAVVLLRGADYLPPATALAATIVVIAAQTAASLAWITVSGEDAPELIAAAPVRRAEVECAKIRAVGVPVLVILALPLAGLVFVSPAGALLAAVFAAAAGTSTALLNLWHPMPGNRRGMLRRHSQSKLMALVEHLLAMLWAVAIFLAVLGSPWAIAPVVLVVLVLAFFRPSKQPTAAGRTQALDQRSQPRLTLG